jgi:hypothetical protein
MYPAISHILRNRFRVLRISGNNTESASRGESGKRFPKSGAPRFELEERMIY